MRFNLACACVVLFSATPIALAEAPATAVERAARGFRIEVYETFRTDRHQYDQRRAVGDGLIQHWDAAGRPEQWNEELAAWFTEATQASHAKTDLPPLPDLLPVPVAQPVAEPVIETPESTESPGVESPEPSEGNADVTIDAADTAEPETSQISAPANNGGSKAGALKAIGNAFWRAVAE